MFLGSVKKPHPFTHLSFIRPVLFALRQKNVGHGKQLDLAPGADLKKTLSNNSSQENQISFLIFRNEGKHFLSSLQIFFHVKI